MLSALTVGGFFALIGATNALNSWAKLLDAQATKVRSTIPQQLGQHILDPKRSGGDRR